MYRYNVSDFFCYMYFKIFLIRLEYNLIKLLVVNFLYFCFIELVIFGKKKNKKDELNS